MIATDGGVANKPIPVTRTKLMVGGRVELLVNLNGDWPGSTVALMAFNSRQPSGFPGGEPGSGPPNGSYLNNPDFRVLRISVAAPTAQRIMKLPGTLKRNVFPKEAEATGRRGMEIVRSGPPERQFAFERKYFEMHVINQS